MVAVGSGERIVAGWILEQRLGSGGYGEVWRARRRHVDLVRALKLIPIVSEGAFESWRHEIGRLEALNHPNVVRFYDADIVSEGLYRDHAWIATELCERSLSDGLRLREGHVLPWTEGERLLDAMLAALSAAHAAGMVHRDIKPANILRHRDGTWKLCDFGTARLVPADATHPVTQVIGTSPYMSPAAHRGQQNQAADLYALAVTMHEALLGQRLHPRPEGITDGEYVKVVLDTPPTISAELPRRWRTVVEALIGRHGPLTAAQLASWFTTTRGDHPPTAATAGSPAGSPAPPNGGGAAASPPGSGGTGRAQGATGATVVAGAAAAAAASGAALPSGTNAPAAKGPAPLVPPGAPSSPSPSPSPSSPSPTSGESRRVHVPAPKVAPPPPPPSPRPAAVQPPPQPWAPVGGPPPGARPPAPQPVAPTPPPIWTAAAVDPTAPMGRRIVATLLDGFLIVLLVVVIFGGPIARDYEQIERPSGSDSESVDYTCSEFADQYPSCYKIGNTLYGAATDTTINQATVFAIATAVLFLVVLQGLTGATIGKLLVGLRVVDRDGRPPGMRLALARTLLLIVDGFPYWLPVLGWVIAMTNARRRRIGDFAAGTMVVRRQALAYIRR